MAESTDPRSEPKDIPDLPRGIALAWGVAANPQRGPKREISIERIVEAAVRIADQDGIDAVSMAAVAKALGYSSMSLYRYVSAKDDLLLLMQEDVTSLPPEWGHGTYVDSDAENSDVRWRGRLEELYRAQVEIFIRHPWMLSLPSEGTPVTPNSSAWLEAGLAALAQTPLTIEERLAVTLAVFGQSRWHGMVVSVDARAARSTGLSPDELSAREHELFSVVIDEDQFPHVRQAVEEGLFLNTADPFQFGVARLLDGVEAYLAGLERGDPHEEPFETIEVEHASVAQDKRYRAAEKTTLDAQRALQKAEKALRQARKAQRQALREARERATRRTSGD